MGKEQRVLSHIAEDRGKVVRFEKCGFIEVSGSKKSLKILIDDPDKAFTETYYVGIGDIETVLREPSKVATIVKRIEQE